MAWDRLVALYSPLVLRWCRRKFGLQSSDAENVAQDAFTAVFRKLATFRRDEPEHSFRGWLYRITHNKAVDYRRKQRPGSVGAGGSDAKARIDDVPNPELDAQDLAEETRMLHLKAVELIRGEFSERDWQAFDRVVMAGERPADVAADLGTTVNIVYLAKSRILRRLREEFDGLIEGQVA